MQLATIATGLFSDVESSCAFVATFSPQFDFMSERISRVRVDFKLTYCSNFPRLKSDFFFLIIIIYLGFRLKPGFDTSHVSVWRVLILVFCSFLCLFLERLGHPWQPSPWPAYCHDGWHVCVNVPLQSDHHTWNPKGNSSFCNPREMYTFQSSKNSKSKCLCSGASTLGPSHSSCIRPHWCVRERGMLRKESFHVNKNNVATYQKASWWVVLNSEHSGSMLFSTADSDTLPSVTVPSTDYFWEEMWVTLRPSRGPVRAQLPVQLAVMETLKLMKKKAFISLWNWDNRCLMANVVGV